VGTVKAEGKVMMSLPMRLRARLISGNRIFNEASCQHNYFGILSSSL
jgi:hypothetical protein